MNEVEMKIQEYLEILPTRYHKEFKEDVIMSPNMQTMKSLRKVFEYYLEDIQDELSTDEQKKIFR